MSNRNVARMAWAWCGLVIIDAFVAALYSLRALPAGTAVLEITDTVAQPIIFAAFAVTGTLIITRQPRNVVGWLLIIEASLAFFWPLDNHFSSLTEAPVDPSILTYIGLWIFGWGWLWYIFPLLFIPLFFPTGKLPSPRWRWVVVLGLGLCAFFILFTTFMEDFLNPNETWLAPNPIGFLPADSFPDTLWVLLLLSFAILCVASLFVRYWRAQSVEREQIKWLLYAAALFLGLYSLDLVFRGANDLLPMLRGFVVVLLPAAWWATTGTQENLGKSKPHQQYADASAWQATLGRCAGAGRRPRAGRSGQGSGPGGRLGRAGPCRGRRRRHHRRGPAGSPGTGTALH